MWRKSIEDYQQIFVWAVWINWTNVGYFHRAFNMHNKNSRKYLVSSKTLHIFDHLIFDFHMKNNFFPVSANDAESESESEPEEILQSPKIIKILFDCIDCSNSFPSRIALEKHECNTETIHNQCNLCFKEYVNI